MIFRNFTYLYTGLIFVAAAYGTFTESQPALLWIDLFAPNPGDTYSIKLVFLLTLLTLLMPLLLLHAIVYGIRKSIDTKTIKNVSSTDTGIWINRKAKFQSFFVDVPLFIDNKKTAMLYSGAKKFLPLSPGSITIRAGKGLVTSQELHFNLQPCQQIKTELETFPKGFLMGLELKEIK
jgi:hypothetical protein